MLKESKIPLKRKDRDGSYPLIIAGGPCATANPMPLADYIDLFIIGEGENTINEFLDVYQNSQNKDLKKYLELDGIYIPEFDNKTKMTIIDNMNETYHITQPIISRSDDENYQSIFNNSIMLNVSRGCTRGCRFCMAGYLYRPIRQTNWKKLIDIAIENRKNTGLNKITLIIEDRKSVV